MKIAMLTSFFFPHRGGTEKYVYDLSHELINKGDEVTIFTHTKGAETAYGDLRVIRIPSLWITYQPLAAVKLKKRLEKFDVVHFHVPPYFFLSNTFVPPGIKKVITYHCDIIIPESIWGLRLPKVFRKAIDSYFRNKSMKLLKGSQAVIATSKDYAESSPVLKEIPYVEIPIGINIEEYESPASAEPMYPFDFLFIGRLASSKGINVLLRAVEVLHSREVPFSLKIIGTGEEFLQLKNMTVKLDLQNHVTFLGQVSQEDVKRALRAAKVLILSSISRLEAFGIVQLEAFSCKTPVVVSNLPGVRGLVRNSGGGWIIPVGDYLKLADTLEQIIADPVETRKRGEQGSLYISENNRWSSIADQVRFLYTAI